MNHPEVKMPTEIHTDKDGYFTIICKKEPHEKYFDCYLIYEKTKDIRYMGGFEREDITKLDKIGDNILLYYETDILLEIIERLLEKEKKNESQRTYKQQ